MIRDYQNLIISELVINMTGGHYNHFYKVHQLKKTEGEGDDIGARND